MPEKGIEYVYGSGRDNLKQFLKVKYDDDSIDRWHRVYTCAMLIVFAMVLSTTNYVGKPMYCWLQPYDGVRQEYVDTLCWIKNTYFLPLRQHIPENIPPREERELNYYQWVPIILLCQCFLFYLPCTVWRSLSTQSGINITSLVSAIFDKSNIDPDKREKSVEFLSKHLDRCFEFQREYCAGSFAMAVKKKMKDAGIRIGKRFGNFLYLLYIFVKVLYLMNVYMQLVVLNWFLGTEYYIYGIDLMKDIMSGRSWRDTGRFPRVTMCDFQLRVLGNLHRHTCQCVLPINLFNEKVFIFIWFWLFILAIMTSFNFLLWIKRMLPSYRKIYIKKYMSILSAKQSDDRPEKITKRSLENFVFSYLKIDGIFVIRLVSLNTSDLIAAELLHGLWKVFAKRNNLSITDADSLKDRNTPPSFKDRRTILDDLGRPSSEADTLPLKDRNRTIPHDRENLLSTSDDLKDRNRTIPDDPENSSSKDDTTSLKDKDRTIPHDPKRASPKDNTTPFKNEDRTIHHDPGDNASFKPRNRNTYDV